jgi:hypothetical protein
VDLSWPLVLLAAFAGGALNAVAGGGSFLTLPALLFVGVAPVTANATGTLALLPGYIASSLGYRRELGALRQTQPWWPLLLLSLLGGAAGATLLLVTPDTLFRQLVPWLLLLATLLFLFAPRLLGQYASVHVRAFLPGIFLVSVYGGYFNGGLGILLMALYALTSPVSVQHANAAKNLLSALLTSFAAVIYIAGDAVQWSYALPMMAAGWLGGYVGARWGRRLPARTLRIIIIATGAIMTLLFFING